MYKKIEYNSKEEATIALKKMVVRHREWVEQIEKELKELSLPRKLQTTRQ